MRLIHLLPLVPLVAAAPSRPIGDTVPELAVEEWASVQSGFFGSIAKWNKVADWTWGKAEQVIDNLEQEYEGEGYGDGEEELTIWQQLNADPNSFSKLVKIIKVSGSMVIELARCRHRPIHISLSSHIRYYGHR